MRPCFVKKTAYYTNRQEAEITNSSRLQLKQNLPWLFTGGRTGMTETWKF